MEALKGIARRATQSVRENLSVSHVSDEEKLLLEMTGKVHQYERAGISLTEKLARVSRLYGELGQLIKSIAEDYQTAPDKCSETELMCDGLVAVGNQLVLKGVEFQNTLKEHAQNPISMFLKEIPKLKDVEDDRAKKKLEFDFFKAKVLELRKDPPKDSTRIPRNEQILESWRVELWKATETNKAAVSALYSQGKQVLDRSILVFIQTTGNFVHSSATCLKQHLFHAKLPVYPQGPILVPSPLPPNPLPPFQVQVQIVSPNLPSQWQAPSGWASQGVQSAPVGGWGTSPQVHTRDSVNQNVPSNLQPQHVEQRTPQTLPETLGISGGGA